MSCHPNNLNFLYECHQTSQTATAGHMPVGVDLVSCAAEDFEAGHTTRAITTRVIFCVEEGFIAGWYAEIRGAGPVAAIRSRATLPIAVSRLESSVLSSRGVFSWGGMRDGGKGSSDNEELHSIKKNNKISVK